MVELMGAGYVAEYCITRFRHKQEERQYRSYIADVLMTINNNLTSAFGGTAVMARYIDLNKPVDTRSGDDIAIDIITRAGLSFEEEE